uniref:Uncharacterized protein n=1 Tax=Anguilla anguilla TaxID=7936 RepID=A0A0E9U3P1_ANGAN
MCMDIIGEKWFLFMHLLLSEVRFSWSYCLLLLTPLKYSNCFAV